MVELQLALDSREYGLVSWNGYDKSLHYFESYWKYLEKVHLQPPTVCRNKFCRLQIVFVCQITSSAIWFQKHRSSCTSHNGFLYVHFHNVRTQMWCVFLVRDQCLLLPISERFFGHWGYRFCETEILPKPRIHCELGRQRTGSPLLLLEFKAQLEPFHRVAAWVRQDWPPWLNWFEDSAWWLPPGPQRQPLDAVLQGQGVLWAH